MAEEKKIAKSIEDAFSKLDATIEKMSDENLSLEKALELYDKGVLLLKYCDDEIDKAEKKIEIIREKGSAND